MRGGSRGDGISTRMSVADVFPWPISVEEETFSSDDFVLETPAGAAFPRRNGWTPDVH